MARPKVDKGAEATLKKLLAAAVAEFGRAGYRAVRLDDIAKRVGITRQSLLYHWPNKECLYRAVIHKVFLDLGVALSGAMVVKGNFAQRLDALVDHFVGFVGTHEAVAPLVLREMLDGVGPGHQVLLGEVAPVLDEVEKFLRSSGRGRMRARLPVRGVMMQVVSSVLLRAAAGDLAKPLWGHRDVTRELTRLLVLEGGK